jgi:hypothetical protein
MTGLDESFEIADERRLACGAADFRTGTLKLNQAMIAQQPSIAKSELSEDQHNPRFTVVGGVKP